MVGDSFYKRGTYMRLILGGSKIDGSPPPQHKSSCLYVTGFSHVHCAGVFNITSLSQCYVVGAASESKKGKRSPHFKDREAGEELLQLTGQLAVVSF